MLNPDYLYNVSDRAIELYEKLNSFVISDICRRLVNADWQFTGSIDWQMYKLQQSGMLLDDIVTEVAKITKKSEKEIAEIFEEATYTSQSYDNSVYKRAGLTPIDIKQSPTMLKILQAAYAQTMGEIRNFTRTTASAGQSLFMETMDDVYFRVVSGQQSYAEAVRQAVNAIASSGMTIIYPTGHKDTIETAVRRCVLTGVGQATARVSIQNASEMETDLVLVSAHLGARPSHAEWQGEVFSISGNSKKYRKLSEATGYGTVSGLCGANCRHHFMPYIEGVSYSPYDDYDSKENEEYYNNQQSQRKKERDIRTTKRELQALKESIDATSDEKLKFVLQQDYDKKAAQLKLQNASYKEFCANTGLRTQQERLQMAGWSHKEAAGARSAAKRYEDSLNDSNIEGGKIVKGKNQIFKGKSVKECSQIANELSDKYVVRKSKWSGNTIVNDEVCKKEDINGRKQWNCDILIKSNAKPKTYIHEHLHARSASYLNRFKYIRHGSMEEASVELFAREICRKESITYLESRNVFVDALRKINAIVKIQDNDFDFAKTLFEKELPVRYTYLENRVKRFLKNGNEEYTEELEGYLQLLRGHKK